MNYRFTPVVENLPSTVPFVGPEAQERQRGVQFRARIGANESVFGPSPKAVRAMQQEALQVWKYGDPENHDLKEALGAHHGIAPDNIVVGEGIDGLFGYTARLFVSPGVPVATSLGAYPTFNYQVAACGGQITTVPYRDDREDPDALLALTREHRAPLVYLANPDNPMGSWWDAADVQRMIENLPDGAVLCLDEAYGDFAPAGTLPEIDVTDSRLLRFRTFSKAHGLAGCRIGYAIGEAQLIKSFDKLRNHFGVNRLAQAGALASLADREHLHEVVHKVARARERIAAIAQENQLRPLPSAANFMAIDCGRDGDYAGRVVAELIARNVFVRMPGVAPLNRCIRVSAGTDDDLRVLAMALPPALQAAR
ncbi:MAG: pyridoxal phosphate-dependent aminotransferase [Gammaproteobacteria bacterium]|nr:pyridoxal phosphate-dependent aminotransferase [Gammaproteobacteria bacterium]